MASSASSSTMSATKPTALPTEEALQILLSPDGYYKYLGISKPEPEAMGLKYREAMAAGSGAKEGGGIDLDQVKKNYRRLTLKHHPDRKTGDAETFRMLNRAKVVLSSAKLRREYDLVGLDLEDDAEEEHHEEGDSAEAQVSSEKNGEGEDGNGEAHHEDSGKDRNSSKTETVMGHLASATLAAVLQVVVRTGLMGLVSVLISRYTILTFLAMGVLAFLSTKIYLALKKTLGPTAKLTLATMKDALSPLLIAFGIFCMYRGRRFLVATATVAVGAVDETVVEDSATVAAVAQSVIEYADWSWTFLMGETIVMTCFISNSFDNRPSMLLALFSVLSLLLSLWLRGRFWRYATILGFEGLIAVLVVLAFPIMEMILESIVEEKMRKVGEKIRAHDVRMKEMLRRKKENKGRVDGAS